MIKTIIFILLLLPTISFTSCLDCHAIEFNPTHEVVITAKQYLNVREKTNHNDSPEIDRWLKNCGLGKGYSYCQAYTVNCYKETYEKHGLKSPYPMYAGVARVAEYCTKNSLKFKVISTKKLIWGVDSPQEGDIASWKHGKSQFTGFGYNGHAGLVKYAKGKDIYTIEGNTKVGEGGDQSGTVLGDMRYGHEGVYERIRNININSNFPIMYFIRSK